MHAGILFERGALAMDAWVERDGYEGPLQRLSTRGCAADRQATGAQHIMNAGVRSSVAADLLLGGGRHRSQIVRVASGSPFHRHRRAAGVFPN
jgi:hypothetical protein